MDTIQHKSLPLSGNIRAFPSPRANHLWTQALRDILLREKFDAFVLELPDFTQELILEGVQQLPQLSIVHLDSSSTHSYIPIDPCDSLIEVCRQNLRTPEKLIFSLEDQNPPTLPTLWTPDPNYIQSMTLAEYQASLAPIIQKEGLIPGFINSLKDNINTLKGINPKSKVLWIGSARSYYFLYQFYHQPDQIDLDAFSQEETDTTPEVVQVYRYNLKPEQAYFALGELPFYTGILEKNRQDPFAQIPDLPHLIKDLWIQTRWDHLEGEENIRKIPTTKIQRALQYLRNLAWLEGRLAPGLMDIVEAAQGVFGDTFASKVLEAARYYPFFDPFDENTIELRPDSLICPRTQEEHPAINLFRDSNFQWRPIQLRPEVKPEKMQEYRYSWDPNEMCSHLPEDVKIEQFNQHLRSAALKQLNEELSKSEPFTSSLKDGLDIRATLRNWHTGEIYVKETPPKLGSLDTVVILFDTHHDELYPHQTVWFAEHPGESTLTFYSTDPFAKMIGPGIAEAQYGGLSLLFPPRHTADPFRDPYLMSQCDSYSEVLLASALAHSQEKNVCVVSPQAPTLKMKSWAQKFGKKIIYLPFSKFSLETLEKLRKFHILNGKDIRSYAKRFIGE